MSDTERITYDTSWGRRLPARIGRAILLMGILKPLIWLHVRPKVHGRERLEGVDGPVLIAANHASHLDTPVIMQSLPARLRRRTGVVAAADYFFNKRLTAWFVTIAFATLPIERKSLSPLTQQRIEQMLEDGWSMLVYPEGTRTKSGKLQPLKSGTARFAIGYGLPIVPVYLTGTYESHGKGSKWPTPHQVTVRFGAPIPPDAEGGHRALTDRLRDELVALAAESGHAEP